MNDAILVLLLMGAFLYALGVGITLLIGTADYSGSRGLWENEEGKREALRTIRRCLIWPTLFSLRPLGRFLAELHRDLRRKR